jgi:hypothetical protein
MAVKMSNPGLVRRDFQSSYDRYMRREQLVLRISIPGVDKIVTAKDPDARELAHGSVVNAYPRKSRGLVASVLHEIVFEQQGLLNHRHHARQILEPVKRLGTLEGDQEMASFYLSGFGRNACALSGVTIGRSGNIGFGPVVMSPSNALRVASSRGVNGFAIIDPDFGLGDIVGRTPDVTNYLEGDLEVRDYSLGNLGEAMGLTTAVA